MWGRPLQLDLEGLPAQGTAWRGGPCGLLVAWCRCLGKRGSLKVSWPQQCELTVGHGERCCNS